jgi:hypothetical protein
VFRRVLKRYKLGKPRQSEGTRTQGTRQYGKLLGQTIEKLRTKLSALDAKKVLPAQEDEDEVDPVLDGTENGPKGSLKKDSLRVDPRSYRMARNAAQNVAASGD